MGQRLGVPPESHSTSRRRRPVYPLCFCDSLQRAVTMSTPRRSQRSSASATPRRSARAAGSSQIPQSSPGPDEQLQAEASLASQRSSQATPRNPRFQEGAASSPLFFRSSPANGSSAGQAGAGADRDTDGDRTPRASGMTIGGIYCKRTLSG